MAKFWPLFLPAVPWLAFVIVCIVYSATLGTAEVETMSKMFTATTVAMVALSIFAIVKAKGYRAFAVLAVLGNGLIGLYASMMGGMSLTHIWF